MRLADFFERVGPFLEGTAALEPTLAALHGERVNADARRLAIYGRFCRIHRFRALELVYLATREAVLARGGASAWESLVEEYFRAHPMRHTELNENGAAFAQFLLGRAADPAWLAELADYEWWEWRTRMAPDDPTDAAPDAGALRLASTVELRPYHADVVAWVEAERWADEPRAAESLLLYWRDRDLDGRCEPARPIELMILKMVVEGQSIAAPPPGVSTGPWTEAVRDLRAAGIVLGVG